MASAKKAKTPRSENEMPLQLTPGLALKLGKLLTHLEEWTSPGGHDFDLEEIKHMIQDREIKAWLGMFPKVLLPLKRSER